jgi:hypothetical protein
LLTFGAVLSPSTPLRLNSIEGSTEILDLDFVWINPSPYGSLWERVRVRAGKGKE